MSRHPKVVPWRSEGEISLLRDWFYSNDCRERALSRVKAYQTRGPVPQSIETTANLVSAVLNDNERNDSYSVRLGYSMAIVRFVNGMLDPYQKSREAISMYTLAKFANLPSFFVELRHVATHEGLPSLELLREGTRRAIDWLWDNFWSLNSHDTAAAEMESAEYNIRRETVKELMRQWRRMRRSDPTKEVKPGDGSTDGQQYWKLVKEIQNALQKDEIAFMDTLYTMNVLIPTGKDGSVKKSALDPSIRLFDPLLDALNNDGFVDRLARYGLDMVDAQPGPFDWTPKEYREEQEEEQETSNKDYYSSIVHWIKHFITPRNKRGSKPWLDDADSLIEHCLESPRPWNVEILQHYVDKVPSANNRVKTLVQDMANQINFESTNSNKRKVEEIEAEVNSFSKRLRKEQDQTINDTPNEADDWSVCQNWSPRPIGVL
ncbi:hypothetical protein TRICI_001817 [Trichomonascus ciferrii]|uniref:Uncharacterized protein n=1 Tax=Trichomonascus ciferrii TaxID=44093 RepID=A0A642V7E1_9ASCO|nr:hypothetical protein TRICI_001817 [Trichomonascus ciferrii]